MSISKSYNKNTGITYVYDVYENYWDKEKKKNIQKRKMIGKIDPETGEIVPTRSRSKKTNAEKSPSNSSGQPNYESLYRQAQSELDQTKLELSLLQNRYDSLKKQLNSVLRFILPTMEEQIDYLHQLEEEISHD